MIYIFDLDYMLLDTSQQRKAIAESIELKIKEYQENYYKNFKSRKKFYNAYQHIDILYKEGRFSANKRREFIEKIDKLVKTIDLFVFDRAEILLKELQDTGADLILATRGDLAWQRKKVNNLRIKKYFSKIIITNKDKGWELKFLNKIKEDKIIINDNAREAFSMKRAISKAQIYLTKGPYSHNIKHSQPVYSLSQLIAILINENPKATNR